MSSVKDTIIVIQNLNKNDCDKVMLNEMKTSNSSILGEKIK